jgi:antibiotic biosynthesis monooxygenase (ABM) superfamily enzyme
MAMLTGPFETSELPRLGAEPVTVTVSRVVLPGQEAAFEEWADRMQVVVSRFPGSLGTGVLRPGLDGDEYHVIFRFTDAMSLRQWERSVERARLLDEVEPLVGTTRVQRTVGVDSWFELPERADPPTPRWRRYLTDVLLVYPVSITVSLFLAPKLGGIPLALRVLLVTALITSVMMLVVAPARRHVRRRRTL